MTYESIIECVVDSNEVSALYIPDPSCNRISDAHLSNWKQCKLEEAPPTTSPTVSTPPPTSFPSAGPVGDNGMSGVEFFGWIVFAMFCLFCIVSLVPADGLLRIKLTSAWVKVKTMLQRSWHWYADYHTVDNSAYKYQNHIDMRLSKFRILYIFRKRAISFYSNYW